MAISRMSRLEDKKAKKRLFVAALGTVAFFAFFGLFGLKILVGFSLFADKLRGGAPTPTPDQSVIAPPILDALPTATKSASITLKGSGLKGLTTIIYVNNEEAKKTVVGQNGNFSATIPFSKEGIHHISAKFIDEKQNASDLSNILSVFIKKTPPILELTSPEENATISGDDNRVTLTGRTEDDTTITVNGRIVVVKSDHTFSYLYPLNTGDNKLTVLATDIAGNTTSVERNVTYQK